MAPLPHQIAGAVLEEAVLAVIRIAGFETLEHLHGDPTIDSTAAPVTIFGRGASHQIDAVADPVVGYPFSNPARLLVEAKAYAPERRVGLDIVRNAVGTLKDLGEFWRPAQPPEPRVTRYHYRYAIFATSEFTQPAQHYAYAQDVYLLPLRRSPFFGPVVAAIDNLRVHFEQHPWPEDQQLKDYRDRVRLALKGRTEAPEEFLPLVEAVRRVGVGLIGIAGRQFPLFLVPRTPGILRDLAPLEPVRIYWDAEGWYLRRPNERQNLFSFDLPKELFSLYADNGALRQEQAIRMKAERLGAIQAFYGRNGEVRLVQFQLDRDWIDTLLRRSGTAR